MGDQFPAVPLDDLIWTERVSESGWIGPNGNIFFFFSSFRLVKEVVKEARDGPRLGVHMVGVAEQLGLAAGGSGRLVRAAVYLWSGPVFAC